MRKMAASLVAICGILACAPAQAQGVWGVKGNDGHAFTSPVGLFRKNAFGLQDMHGNSMQWCSDVFADYPRGEVIDLRQKTSRKPRFW